MVSIKLDSKNFVDDLLLIEKLACNLINVKNIEVNYCTNIISFSGKRNNIYKALLLIKENNYCFELVSFDTSNLNDSFWNRYTLIFIFFSSCIFIVLGYSYHVCKSDMLTALSVRDIYNVAKYPLITFILYCITIILGLIYLIPKTIKTIKLYSIDLNFITLFFCLLLIYFNHLFEAAFITTSYSFTLLVKEYYLIYFNSAISKLDCF